MELNKIENLLDKYFDGNTSLKEENILKEYFATNDVPAHLEDYKAMFSYFAQNKEEVSQKSVQVKTKKKTWRVNWLMTSAAALLLFVSVYQFVPKGETKFTEAEIKEAQMAFNETKKAFQLISENLNKGNNAIAYLNEYESTKNKIFKQQ